MQGDSGTRTRVLVVEDDRALREAMATFIRGEGYVVDEAGDGEEALAAVERARPDIICLDLLLPRMDGYQVVETLVRRYGGGRPKIVALSAAERLDLAKARLGADAYLAKPFDVERLSAALSRLAAFVARRPQRPATVP
jgi:two-component system response regulator MprA